MVNPSKHTPKRVKSQEITFSVRDLEGNQIPHGNFIVITINIVCMSQEFLLIQEVHVPSFLLVPANEWA